MAKHWGAGRPKFTAATIEKAVKLRASGKTLVEVQKATGLHASYVCRLFHFMEQGEGRVQGLKQSLVLTHLRGVEKELAGRLARIREQIRLMEGGRGKTGHKATSTVGAGAQAAPDPSAGRPVRILRKPTPAASGSPERQDVGRQPVESGDTDE